MILKDQFAVYQPDFRSCAAAYLQARPSRKVLAHIEGIASVSDLIDCHRFQRGNDPDRFHHLRADLSGLRFKFHSVKPFLRGCIRVIIRLIPSGNLPSGIVGLSLIDAVFTERAFLRIFPVPVIAADPFLRPVFIPDQHLQ